MMKVILILLFAFPAMARGPSRSHVRPVQGDWLAAGKDRVLALSHSRSLTVTMQPNDGEGVVLNRISMKLNCGDMSVVVPPLMRVCSLRSVDYDKTNEIVTLHLGRYNPASAQGDCSGPEYTRTVNVKSLCADDAKKKQN